MTSSCTVEKVIHIKTGSYSGFRMIYTGPGSPGDVDRSIVARSLEEVEIHVSFINPRTRVVLAECYKGNGILVVNESCGEFIVDPGSTIKWPLGYLPFDIKYTVRGASQHTKTILLNVTLGHSQGTQEEYINPDLEPPFDPAIEIPGELEPPEELPPCVPTESTSCTNAASEYFLAGLTEKETP